MNIPLSRRRRLRWSAVGFVLGYLAMYGLQLADLANPHFEVLYETIRPRGLLAVLQFQHTFEATFLLAGVVGAAAGFLASFAIGRDEPAARAL